MYVLLPKTKECQSYTRTSGTPDMLLCLRKNMVEEEFKLPGVPAEGEADHQNHTSLESDMTTSLTTPLSTACLLIGDRSAEETNVNTE